MIFFGVRALGTCAGLMPAASDRPGYTHTIVGGLLRGAALSTYGAGMRDIGRNQTIHDDKYNFGLG